MGRKNLSKKNKSKKLRLPCHINQVDSDGTTPLHKAAEDKTQHHLLKKLLRSDNRVNCRDHKGNYPLLLAVSNGCSLEVLSAFLAAGADVRVKQYQCNVLDWSLDGKVIPVIKELCCRFPELCEDDGRTPLRHALEEKCKFDIFEVLWQNHTTSNFDRFNTSLLSSAVRGECDIQIVEVIIEKYKSMINIPDEFGILPIHLVSTDVKVLKALIEAGSDLWHKEQDGLIPLRFVLQENEPSPEVIREFLNHMDPERLVEDEKALGFSLLHSGQLGWIASCGNYTKGFETLLEIGFDPLTKYSGNESAVEGICSIFEKIPSFKFSEAEDILRVLLRKHPAIFLECKYLRDKCFTFFEKKEHDKQGTTKFTESIIKWIAIQDRSLARQTLQPEGSFKPQKYYLSYFEKALAELKMLRNFKLTASKSLHDLILEDYMNPTFRTDVSKRLSFWKECENAIAFDANSISIYKKEVSDVQDIVFSCQLYNERLCTKKENSQVMFLTCNASKLVLDYLCNSDLFTLAKTLMDPALWELKMHLSKLHSSMGFLKDETITFKI